VTGLPRERNCGDGVLGGDGVKAGRRERAAPQGWTLGPTRMCLGLVDYFEDVTEKTLNVRERRLSRERSLWGRHKDRVGSLPSAQLQELPC
jgi:hypothetical protein